MIKCPCCATELHCPCESCINQNEGKALFVWDDNGEFQSCGKCGFKMHADGWLDLEWELMKGEMKSETRVC